MLDARSKRGIIIGICIAVLIIAAIVLAIVKINWIKKTFGLGCCCDDFDDDYFLDDDLDENGCVYTSEKDFI